jgi:dTDP-4-dehydrorhamnose 3,5-epimerase-like enzyme
MNASGIYSEISELEFISLGDRRGELIALEHLRSIPFEIKRIFYIFGTTSGVSRGYHAHHELRQVLVAVAGSCTVKLESTAGKREVKLSTPTKGLLVGGMVWHEMHDFSDDCVLLSIASDVYDKKDYVRDYDQFKSIIL